MEVLSCQGGAFLSEIDAAVLGSRRSGRFPEEMVDMMIPNQ